MPVFRCYIRGENFPGSLMSQKEPLGFYTTRFVQADSPAEAEMAALSLLREDAFFGSVRPEDRMEHAKVYFEQIEEVPEAPGGPGEGFTFFPMGG